VKSNIERSVAYPLRNGGFTTIDSASLYLLEGRVWKWVVCGKAKKKKYVASDKWTRGKCERIYLHRLVMGVVGAGRGYPVDHIDGDSLNNTKVNLRICTYAQNSQNVSTRKKYRGVFKQGRGFVARVGRSYFGFFPTADLAAVAYDIGARRLYGSEARVNFHVAND
jgi:hypothetical protein